MNESVTHHRSFACICDRCHEAYDAATEDLTGGCYCPTCRAEIVAANANPVTDVRELLDAIGRNRYKALYALHLGEE